MKDNKQGTFSKILRSPATWISLMAVAIVLFLVSGIGSAAAQLTETSEDYVAQVSMNEIGLTLNENGTARAWRNYSDAADGTWDVTIGELFSQVGEGKNIVFGKEYEEVLTLSNSGTIDTYVRVNIHRYWMKDGEKETTLSPELIELGLGDGWIEDKSSETTERITLYYGSLLAAGAETSPFMETLSISNELATKVHQEVDGNTITTVYDYDGVQFCLEITADAVQGHNAEDAVLSAWGVKVNAGDGTLSLK